MGTPAAGTASRRIRFKTEVQELNQPAIRKSGPVSTIASRISQVTKLNEPPKIRGRPTIRYAALSTTLHVIRRARGGSGGYRRDPGPASPRRSPQGLRLCRSVNPVASRMPSPARRKVALPAPAPGQKAARSPRGRPPQGPAARRPPRGSPRPCRAGDARLAAHQRLGFAPDTLGGAERVGRQARQVVEKTVRGLSHDRFRKNPPGKSRRPLHVPSFVRRGCQD